MTYTAHTCLTVACDTCGPVHLPGRDTACGRALCGDCVDRRSGTVLGHAWTPWSDPDSVALDAHIGRVRHCTRCWAAEWDPPIPGQLPLDHDTHPEKGL